MTDEKGRPLTYWGGKETEETQKYLEYLKLQISLNGLGCCAGCGMTPEAFNQALQAERERFKTAIETVRTTIGDVALQQNRYGSVEHVLANTALDTVLNLINPPSNNEKCVHESDGIIYDSMPPMWKCIKCKQFYPTSN